MNSRSTPRPRSRTDRAWLSPYQARPLALTAITIVVCYLLYRLAAPFFPALTWALALAISVHPFHRWLRSRIGRENIAAALAVVVVAVVIVAPAIFVTHRLVREADQFRQTVLEEIQSGRLRASLEQDPRTAAWLPWVETQLGLPTGNESAPSDDDSSADPTISTESGGNRQAEPVVSVQRAAELLSNGAGAVVSGLAWMLGQLFITFLALFFFFRDRLLAVRFVRGLMPLTDAETDALFNRVDDTVHATVYGSLTVAAVQGTLGGLMFAWLGLPAPILWGAVMGLLAVVPVLGTFVIWAPTAAFLAFRGDWTDALLLAAWGGIAIALVDNFLYPYLVGKRMRFHTLLVFLAMLGGLALFGASGVILGPLVLAVADALTEVWKSRSSPERGIA